MQRACLTRVTTNRFAFLRLLLVTICQPHKLPREVEPAFNFVRARQIWGKLHGTNIEPSSGYGRYGASFTRCSSPNCELSSRGCGAGTGMWHGSRLLQGPSCRCLKFRDEIRDEFQVTFGMKLCCKRSSENGGSPVCGSEQNIRPTEESAISYQRH